MAYTLLALAEHPFRRGRMNDGQNNGPARPHDGMWGARVTGLRRMTPRSVRRHGLTATALVDRFMPASP